MIHRNIREFFLSTANGVWVAVLAGAICFVLGLAFTYHVSGLVQNLVVSQQKQEAVARLAEARARLEGAIGQAVALGQGLRSLVVDRQNRSLDQTLFSRIGAELIDGNPIIRLIALAPDNIVSMVYPLTGNAKAIGLNYRLNAQQWPSIREAMIRRSEVVDGPTQLVQGGRALMVRIPIYPPERPGQALAERQYWGVATMVVDEANLMASAGLTEELDRYRIAIFSNVPGRDDPVFIFGDDSIALAEAVSLPVLLPGALGWELVGIPVAGWYTDVKEVWVTRLCGLAASLLFAVMAFLLVNEVYKVRTMALHDPLTGLANRRLLEDRMQQLSAICERTGGGFEIFYVDLNAFKPVNDNFGHAVGDQLLIEIGQRLRRQIRQSDTVARVGGDEFIILTPGTMEKDERKAFVDRLENRLAQVFVFAGSKIDVQASIGFASFPNDASTIEDLLRVADARMYAHKARSEAMVAPVPMTSAKKAG